MKIVKPSYEILSDISDNNILKFIEKVARTCYKSEDHIKEGSAEKLVKMLVERGHTAMIEHFSISVKFVVNRGVTHELVRHRMASYAQESTRYCNYNKGKFGNEITVVEPYWYENASDNAKKKWLNGMENIEKTYIDLIEEGQTAQAARSVLPIGIKSEIICTANLREWVHIFDLRCSSAAHPDIRNIMLLLLKEMQKRIPIIFDKVYEKYKDVINGV